MRLGPVLVAMCCVACLSSCRFIDDILAEPTRQAAQKELASLSKTIAAQEKSIEKLRSDLEAAIASLKGQVELNEFVRQTSEDQFKRERATVTSDSGNYGIARTDIGPALIVIKGVTPYLDGFKVKLWIAVLAPVISANGAKVTVSWIETEAAFQEKAGQRFRMKEFSLTNQFEGGKYSEVELALTPASASGVKKLFIAFETDRLSVRTPASP